MNKEDIFNNLKMVIGRQMNLFEIEDFNLNMKLKEDLGFDSLRIVGLIIDIEEDFNITFDVSDLDPNELITVENLVKLVDNTVNK